MEVAGEKSVIQNAVYVYTSQYILGEGSSKETVFGTKGGVSSLCCGTAVRFRDSSVHCLSQSHLVKFISGIND